MSHDLLPQGILQSWWLPRRLLSWKDRRFCANQKERQRLHGFPSGEPHPQTGSPIRPWLDYSGALNQKNDFVRIQTEARKPGNLIPDGELGSLFNRNPRTIGQVSPDKVWTGVIHLSSHAGHWSWAAGSFPVRYAGTVKNSENLVRIKTKTSAVDFMNALHHCLKIASMPFNSKKSFCSSRLAL